MNSGRVNRRVGVASSSKWMSRTRLLYAATRANLATEASGSSLFDAH